MQRNDALDEEVARTIFGFWIEEDERGPHWYGPHPATPGAKAYASCSLPTQLWGSSMRFVSGLPFFSSDRSAAWAVIDKVNERFSTRHAFVEALREMLPRASTGERVDPSWWVFFLTPEMICRAALAAHDRLGAVPVQPTTTGPGEEEA